MNTAKIVERGSGWAIEVEISDKTGFVGKAFNGVTIFTTPDAAQQAATERGYVVVNAQQPKIIDVDERGGVAVIETNDPAGILAAVGIPLAGVITPQPDPVYGHTFQMPDISKALQAYQQNGQRGIA